MNEITLVKIKKLTNGLKLVLDEKADFEELLRELGKKCSDGRSFFGNSTVAISIEGRELSEVEEIRILETIHINCNLNVICILEHDEEMNYKYIKAIKSMEMRLAENTARINSDGHFFRGSLTDGEKLEVDYPLVIMGDINPGCSVISTETIIVLGGLYGEAIIRKKEADDKHNSINDTVAAIAGTAFDDSDNAEDIKPFIIALELIPERVVIHDVAYKPASRSKWGRRKIQPQVAYPKDGRLVVETVSKSVLETVYAI